MTIRVLLLAVFVVASHITNIQSKIDYDAQEAFKKRLFHLQQVCLKYSDPIRMEHLALYPKNQKFNVKKIAASVPHGFALCIPAKNGVNSWRDFLRRLKIEKKIENLPESNPMYLRTNQQKFAFEWYQNVHRAMPIRHPLERLLSTYFYIFVDSFQHLELTKKIQKMWLEKKRIKIDENVEIFDQSGNPTITFKQFVQFLLYSSKDVKMAANWINEDYYAIHWQPYWVSCPSICVDKFQPHYILDKEHMNQDVAQMIKNIGLNTTLSLKQINPSGFANSSDPSVARTYYGMLSKDDVWNLYQLYRLDHELFNYSPKIYLDYAF